MLSNNMSKGRDFIVGCSFTDPLWQTTVPWSVRYSQNRPSYIVAECDIQGWRVHTAATRKRITSGGLNYSRNDPASHIFDILYRHQGFLVIAKEHFRALERLLNQCKKHKITCYVSAIQDPLDQLTGLDYIKQDLIALLQTVNYQDWLRFDGQFIDKFLQHQDHPNDSEHAILCSHIQQYLNKRTLHGQTL